MDERTLARFMSKIEVQPNGCWHWKGKLSQGGYGYFWLDGKMRLAHRVAYEHFIGSIPEGHEVDHLCHTRDSSCLGGVCQHRACVFWGDLEAVTEHENVMRSRGVAAANAAKAACDQGHPFTEENTYFDSRGDRGCRTCQRRRVKNWAEKNRPRKGSHQSAKTHCPQGHPYDEANTYVSPRGGRNCRECTRVKNREAQRRRRAAARTAQTA